MNWYEDIEYWEMCEKANELQEMAKKDPPTTGKYLPNSKVCIDEKGRFFVDDNKIWIPTILELGKMQHHKYDFEYLHDEKKPTGGRIWEYGKIIFETNENSTQKELELFTKRKTDEQFDLCCFMFVMYKKFWDFEKKEWVKD